MEKLSSVGDYLGQWERYQWAEAKCLEITYLHGWVLTSGDKSLFPHDLQILVTIPTVKRLKLWSVIQKRIANQPVNARRLTDVIGKYHFKIITLCRTYRLHLSIENIQKLRSPFSNVNHLVLLIINHYHLMAITWRLVHIVRPEALLHAGWPWGIWTLTDNCEQLGNEMPNAKLLNHYLFLVSLWSHFLHRSHSRRETRSFLGTFSVNYYINGGSRE